MDILGGSHFSGMNYLGAPMFNNVKRTLVWRRHPNRLAFGDEMLASFTSDNMFHARIQLQLSQSPQKEYRKPALPLTFDSACQKHLTQTPLDYQCCIKFIDLCTRLPSPIGTSITEKTGMLHHKSRADFKKS